MSKIVMTRFFCQELLYDYLQKRLTPERAQEVTEFLETDDVCREDLEHLKRAIGYCDKLAAIETPAAWMERWQNLPPALAKRITDWEMKIVSNLWSALPYVVVVLVTGLGLWIFKPWKNFYNREVVVWTAPQIAHEETKTAAVDAPTPAPVVEVKAKKDEAKPETAAPPATPNALTQLPPKEVPENLALGEKGKAEANVVAAAMPQTTPKVAVTAKPAEPIKEEAKLDPLKATPEKVAAVVATSKPKKEVKPIAPIEPESDVAEEETPEPPKAKPVVAAVEPAHEPTSAEEAEEEMISDKTKKLKRPRDRLSRNDECFGV